VVANRFCGAFHARDARLAVEETSRRRDDGEERTCHSVEPPLRGAEGAIHGLCGISTDITEHARTQKLPGNVDAVIATMHALRAYGVRSPPGTCPARTWQARRRPLAKPYSSPSTAQ
jgi:hypothetical protein